VPCPGRHAAGLAHLTLTMGAMGFRSEIQVGRAKTREEIFVFTIYLKV
jgi:uncharacterized membrane protein YsdA (DUF1294 family)